MKSELERRLIDEAYKYGAERCWIDQHRGHPKLRIQRAGATLTYTFSASGSDWRGAENALTGLRRLMGVKREVVKSSRPRSKPQARCRETPAANLSPPLAAPMEDPFAVLATLRDRMSGSTISESRGETPAPVASQAQLVLIPLRTPWLGRRPRWQAK